MTPRQARDALRVCVFGGGLPGDGDAYLAAARGLGDEIAQRGMSLIYGGAYFGLMGALADAALAGGAEVVGVIPRGIAGEVAHAGISRLVLVADLATRKERMANSADAFIALPGGAGTVNELTEVWTMAKLDIHRKPVALLSVAGYYDSFLAFVEHAVNERLVLPEHRDLLLVTDNPKSALDAIEQHWLLPGRPA